MRLSTRREVFILDLSRCFVAVSDGAADLLGRQPRDLVGRNAMEFVEPNPYREEWWSMLLAGERIYGANRLIHRDGGRVPFAFGSELVHGGELIIATGLPLRPVSHANSAAFIPPRVQTLADATRLEVTPDDMSRLRQELDGSVTNGAMGRRQPTQDHFDPLELLTINEVAALTKRHRASVYDDIKAGRLKTVRLGRYQRVPRAEFERFIADLPRE